MQANVKQVVGQFKDLIFTFLWDKYKYFSFMGLDEDMSGSKGAIIAYDLSQKHILTPFLTQSWVSKFNVASL